MTAHTTLGNVLFDNLIKLKEQKGSLNMEDVGTLFEQIALHFNPSETVLEKKFLEEIQNLAVFIKETKNEFSVIAASGAAGDHTDGAALHLDAVIKATEEAGHTIMDAADMIQGAVGGMNNESQEVVNQAITKIYEACNFQDITCQRLSKVIKILDEIDTRVNNALKFFGTHSMKPKNADAPVSAIIDDKDLLNGPQLPNQAPSQADIDALFADLKP